MSRHKMTEDERKRNLSIGRNIKALLKWNEMTQKELSEKLGLTESIVSDYLNGKVNISIGRVQQIADILNVKKTDLDPTLKDYILPQDMDIIRDVVSEELKKISLWGNKRPVEYYNKINMIPIPILGSVAAGEAIERIENIEGYQPTDASRIPGGDEKTPFGLK